MVQIPLDGLPPGRLGQMVDDLTVQNPSYFQQKMHGVAHNVDPVIELYREDGSHIYVPRHYPHGLKVLDRRRILEGGYVEPVEHAIVLRDKTQAEASKALSITNNDKIISLACGKGKTVVSLHAASEGKRFPLLIVVNTNALKDQWLENRDDHGQLVGGIAKFYGLCPSEVGVVQGKECRWDGYPVVVAMLHTLCLKKFEKAFYDYFRLVIFDEVHRLGAQFFADAASQFPCERWGLSATVGREDGMDKVFRQHLGPVVYEALEQDLKPTFYFEQTGIDVDMNKFVSRGGRVNMGKLLTVLSEHKQRNKLVVLRLKQAADQGRTILVLGERLSQLHMFKEQLCEDGYDASVYVGSQDDEERRAALKHQIVCATQHLAKEGLDRPKFDTLFVIIPIGGKGRVQQSGGRILRKLEGKKKPKGYVFIDDISVIQALAHRMRRALASLGWKLKGAKPLRRKKRLRKPVFGRGWT